MSDKEHIALRESVYKTMAETRKFWRDEVARWEAELGSKSVQKLKEMTATILGERKESQDDR